MTHLWMRIHALEGQTLPTVTGREAFDIEAVTNGHVRVVPHKTRKPRNIPRKEFEKAEALGLVRANVTTIELREAGASDYNPTYVAAIIRAIEAP